MIKCVAFDLDGVVIPSEPSFELFEKKYGITPGDFRQFFSGPYQRAMMGACDLYDVLPDALTAWKWRGTTDQFVDVWFNSCCECDPLIVKEIVALKVAGIRCCVATNQDNRRAEFLRRLPLLCELFPDQYFSCAIQAAKPHRDYFARVESLLQLPGAEILFVDDKQENVDGARKHGWNAALCGGVIPLREILSRYGLLSQ
jgi:putative hydrolase of the HAD superfamily